MAPVYGISLETSNAQTPVCKYGWQGKALRVRRRENFERQGGADCSHDLHLGPGEDKLVCFLQRNGGRNRLWNGKEKGRRRGSKSHIFRVPFNNFIFVKKFCFSSHEAFWIIETDCHKLMGSRLCKAGRTMHDPQCMSAVQGWAYCAWSTVDGNKLE